MASKSVLSFQIAPQQAGESTSTLPITPPRAAARPSCAFKSSWPLDVLHASAAGPSAAADAPRGVLAIAACDAAARGTEPLPAAHSRGRGPVLQSQCGAGHQRPASGAGLL